MRKILFVFLSAMAANLQAQIPVDLKGFDKKSGAQATVSGAMLHIEWPAGNAETAKVSIDLNKSNPLIGSLGIGAKEKQYTIAQNLDPAIILTVGKRDLGRYPQAAHNGVEIARVLLKFDRVWLVLFVQRILYTPRTGKYSSAN